MSRRPNGYAVIDDRVPAQLGKPGQAEPSAAAIPTHPRLPVRDKALYAAGDMVDGTVAYATGAYLFFYLTAVCGLSGTLAGLALAISIIVDAVIDPMIGFVSDNTRGRLGRRHPYMFAAAIPVAASLGLIFSVPHQLGGVGLFAWVLAMLLVLRISMSGFTLPYAALGAELTTSYTERSTVVAYRSAFNIFANLVTMFLALWVFLRGQNGLLHRDAYAPFAWCVAILTFFGAMTSAFGTLRLRGRLQTIPAGASASPLRLVGELKDVARNRSFVVLFTCILLFWAAQGTIGVLNLHAVKYFWKLPADVIKTLPLCNFAGLATGIPIAGLILQKVEKRVVSIWGLAILCLFHMLLPPLRIVHVLPSAGMSLWAILGAVEILKGWAGTCVGISFWSMLADAADEHEFLFGSRREGLYFAGLTFSAKAAIGLGSLIAGVALDAINFPRDLAKIGDTHIPQAAAQNLGLIFGPGAGFIALTSAAVLVFYRLDAKRYREIQTELARRKRVRAPA